ncbi:alpha-L-fucosidase [Parapedobacter lycopersici]|uniref:alpha-L-fucosidase n=1 Tax=Parapedobacter lycopersici TaxID=1864939 RepID=UPI00214D3A3D|nr:alpha-L-fucosidase [Parapedobacter lycopersici]
MVQSKFIYLWILIGAACLQGCGQNPGRSEKEPAPYGPVPTAAQLNWHEMEMYCLIHFTPTTFQDKEWGYGDAPADLFNPEHFDADQVAEAAKAAGFKGLITVAKHHDGYCLWPTKTTDYNISQSPWRDGRGDMVKEFMEAAHHHGLQFGVYCSAWDRNHPEYGNEKYAEAYREQLRELYSNYGTLFTSWHDGANGGDGYYGGADEMRRIDRETYYGWEDKVWPITREMQPGAVIFSDVGPDIRWIGNEKGIAPETSWATFTPVGPDGGKAAPGHIDNRFLGTGQRDGKFWIPAECDVPLRPGWFYHASQDQQVKTPDELFAIYLQSVGRGAAFNLGLAPMPSGTLHPADVAALQGFGRKLSETFGRNLADGASFEASNIRSQNNRQFGPDNLLDTSRYTYWSTDDEVTAPELTVDLDGETTFDIIRLRENIKLGQRLDSVHVAMWDNNAWVPLASATSIGANRLIRLEHPVTAQRLRLRLFAPVAVALSDFGLFKEADAAVTVAAPANSGVSRANWRITANGAGSSALRQAIDGRVETFWLSREDELPQDLTIDMFEQQTIDGFGYLPRQDGNNGGMISRYRLESSIDGITWQPLAEGEFSNIVANPIEQHIRFTKPVSARYLRFTAVAVANATGNRAAVSIAELTVYD